MGLGNVLQNILNEKGKKVSELAKDINVSPQTLYSIIKRNNTKVDFEILLKICENLNIDIELFYKSMKEEKPSIENDRELSENEKRLILLFRKIPTDKQQQYFNVFKSIVELTEVQHE
jgi:Helix-turn-helix.